MLYYALAFLIALQADIEWNIKVERLNFVSGVFGKLDPTATLMRGEVGSIDVVHGAARDQARTKHGAQIRKNQVLKALLVRIIEQERANQVAGERTDVVPLKPRTLARSG